MASRSHKADTEGKHKSYRNMGTETGELPTSALLPPYLMQPSEQAPVQAPVPEQQCSDDFALKFSAMAVGKCVSVTIHLCVHSSDSD